MVLTDGTLAARVNVQARQIDVLRMVVTALASFLYAVGWSIAKLIAVVLFATAWSLAAVRLGWQEGRGTTPAHRR